MSRRRLGRRGVRPGRHRGDQVHERSTENRCVWFPGNGSRQHSGLVGELKRFSGSGYAKGKIVEGPSGLYGQIQEHREVV